MSRIYVASSWKNQVQPHVVEVLRNCGHEVYDFKNPKVEQAGFAWEELDPNWENWDRQTYRKLLTTHPRAAQGFMSDLRAMMWADTCVMVLPCGNSAHLELGWMAGQGKRTIILLNEEFKPDLMYLCADDIVLDVEELLQLVGAQKEQAA